MKHIAYCSSVICEKSAKFDISFTHIRRFMNFLVLEASSNPQVHAEVPCFLCFTASCSCVGEKFFISRKL
jgi:hypothetical protein